MIIGDIDVTSLWNSNLIQLQQHGWIEDEELAKWQIRMKSYPKSLKPFLDMLVDKEQSHTGLISVQPQGNMFLVEDKYLLVCNTSIGKGGMGTVYAYWDKSRQRLVAIKFSHTQHNQEEQAKFQTRLMRESRTLERLDHEYIVRFYSTGTAVSPQKIASIYLAMEYIDGGTLLDYGLTKGKWAFQHEQENRPLDTLLQSLLKFIHQTGDALQYMHGQNQVHRDIKPSNIMIHADKVKVVDFGIAKKIEAGQHCKSLYLYSTHAYGTHHFMDPALAKVQENFEQACHALEAKNWKKFQTEIARVSKKYPTRCSDLQKLVKSLKWNAFWDKWFSKKRTPSFPLFSQEIEKLEEILYKIQFCADPKEDLYGLGSTLYHCLTDKCPFDDGKGGYCTKALIACESNTCPYIPINLPYTRFSKPDKIRETFLYLDDLIQKAVQPNRLILNRTT